MSKTTLGILGGGQLALYLVASAKRLGIPTTLIVSVANEPAAQSADRVYIGKPGDVIAAHPELVHDCVWTFENEFLDTTGLKELECYPKFSVLEQLRDKCQQKKILDTLSIPTSSWFAIDADQIDASLNIADARFGVGNWVLKWSEGGYDGKGTYIASTLEAPGALRTSAKKFLQRAPRSFVEQKIAFTRECAIVAVRDQAGHIVFYPLVFSEQENGICRRVHGPAREFGLKPELESVAQQWATTLLKKLDYVGCLAIEFFLDANDTLVVNEIAPRVHNSAHYSMDACEVSQFENHVRAVFGRAVNAPATSARFAMENILGPATLASSYPVPAGKIDWLPLPKFPRTADDRFIFHWYGKDRIQARRKLGHLNLVSAAEPFAAANAQLRGFAFDIEKQLCDRGTS